MKIAVNGVRLFVDTEGSGLVADGPLMREKPTLILLHGGPGADHTVHKPDFGQLSDIAQIIYFDHRGNGRSDDGDPALWTLDQWADDLHRLISLLGICEPILYGASFGGFVAQAFAAKYPDSLGGLVLAVTAPKVDFNAIYDAFARIGGTKAGEVARTYWSDPTPERRQAYFKSCLPLYALSAPDPDMMARMIVKSPVAMHFNGPDNEMGRFDFTDALGGVTCPALVLSGAQDPMMPADVVATLPACLKNADTQYHCLPDAAHLIHHDAPDAVFKLLRGFIQDRCS